MTVDVANVIQGLYMEYNSFAVSVTTSHTVKYEMCNNYVGSHMGGSYDDIYHHHAYAQQARETDEDNQMGKKLE